MNVIQTVLKESSYKGFDFLVRVSPGGHLCGSVIIPRNHSLYGLFTHEQEEVYKDYKLNFPEVLGGRFKYDQNYYISYCSVKNIKGSMYDENSAIDATIDGCKKIIDLIAKGVMN